MPHATTRRVPVTLQPEDALAIAALLTAYAGSATAYALKCKRAALAADATGKAADARRLAEVIYRSMFQVEIA